MSSRALILATVMLLVGCLAAERALAQATNLEAGKSPSQIFAGTCNACHKAPRGLLKTVSPSSLSGFLRQHYTTSPEMANVLASYLVSNGATDTRISGAEKKGAKEGTRKGPRKPSRRRSRRSSLIAGATGFTRAARRRKPLPFHRASRRSRRRRRRSRPPEIKMPSRS